MRWPQAQRQLESGRIIRRDIWDDDIYLYEEMTMEHMIPIWKYTFYTNAGIEIRDHWTPRQHDLMANDWRVIG